MVLIAVRIPADVPVGLTSEVGLRLWWASKEFS